MRIAPERIEDAAKELYVRALKDPAARHQARLRRARRARDRRDGEGVLGTMIENIAVAERTDNLLCQDTGIPIYNVTIGRDVERRRRRAEGGDPARLRAGDARESAALVDRPSADAEERAHVVRHRRAGDPRRLLGRVRRAADRDDPQGQRLGEQLVAADGDPGRRRRRDQDASSSTACWTPAARPARRRSSAWASAAPRTCACTSPRSRRRARSARAARTRRARSSKRELSAAVNLLGVGPQGLGGDATAFAVHVELAATHITMNPVAVNMQCHSARRASARADGRRRRVRLLTASARRCSSAISASRWRRRRSRRGPRSARWCWRRCSSTAYGRCSCCSAGRQVEIVPGITAVTPLLFVSYPYTHSLARRRALGARCSAACYYALRRDRSGALWLAALVLSHWVLDFVVASAGPAAVARRPDVGPRPVVLAAGDARGRVRVVRRRRVAVRVGDARARPDRHLCVRGPSSSTLAAIYVASVFGPPPPSRASARDERAARLAVRRVGATGSAATARPSDGVTTMAHHDLTTPVTEDAGPRAGASTTRSRCNGTLFGIRDATQIAHVRPRPHDAFRPARARGHPHGAQRAARSRRRRRTLRATSRCASARRRARGWSASRGR